MKIVFSAIFASLIFTVIGSLPTQASESRWTVKMVIKKGETKKIQNMTYYRKRTCEWHEKPPVPTIRGKVKLGKITYRKGISSPKVCPNEKINSNIADYTAGQVAGRDKFYISWKATEANHTFRVEYVITVE